MSINVGSKSSAYPFHRQTHQCQERPGFHGGAAATKEADEEDETAGHDEDVGAVFHDGRVVELLKTLIVAHPSQQEERGVVNGQPDAQGQHGSSGSLQGKVIMYSQSR